MSQTRSPRSTVGTRPEPAEPHWRDRLVAHPMAPYYLILGAGMLLLLLGLVMVLSSSSVESYETHDSAFTLFTRQMMFAALGIGLMFIISKMPISLFRRFALAFLVLCVVYDKIPCVAQCIGFPSENAGKNRVKCADPEEGVSA